VAEEESKAAEDQEGQGEGKSKKKLIIIIVLVSILAIGLSVGATLFLLGGDSSDESEDAEVVVEEVVKEPATYLSITPPFLVTYNVEGRQRYMQISVSVSSRDATALDALEHHMPLIRSKLLTSYAGQSFDEVKTDAGKVALQAKTVEVINGVLESEDSGQIENIFFTNFVLQ
jgi:flagellar FliL protein